VVGGLLQVADEEARLLVDDLMPGSANIAANNGSSLPHRFRHREPKALAQ
jgi:hypothetical protein